MLNNLFIKSNCQSVVDKNFKDIIYRFLYPLIVHYIPQLLEFLWNPLILSTKDPNTPFLPTPPSPFQQKPAPNPITTRLLTLLTKIH